MASASRCLNSPSALGSPAGTARFVIQARNNVLNKLKSFEKDKKGPIADVVKKPRRQRVSRVLIHKIRFKGKRSEDEVIRQSLYRQRLSPILGRIDEFDKDTMRQEILAFYERGKLPKTDLLIQRQGTTSEFSRRRMWCTMETSKMTAKWIKIK